MKIRQIAIASLMLASLVLSGCSDNIDNQLDSSESHLILMDYKANNFISPSNNTVKYSEKYLHQFDNEIIEVKKVNEIILTGNNPIYEVNGDIITYKDKEYINLFSEISKIEKPCSNEALINFIVEYFNSSYNQVYCNVNIFKYEQSTDTEGYAGEYINEELEYLDAETDYYRLVERYNKPIEWSIDIYDVDSSGKEFSHNKIYGCTDYMFGLNLDRIISKDYGQLVKSEETIEPEDTTIEPE